jgi:hypothetical protein
MIDKNNSFLLTMAGRACLQNWKKNLIIFFLLAAVAVDEFMKDFTEGLTRKIPYMNRRPGVPC